jgi:hypothetical protein
VHLIGVTNAQVLAITLSNVIDEFGEVLPTANLMMGVLAGDTTGNGTVNVTDVAQAKSQIGQLVNALNLRSDVNVNGTLKCDRCHVCKRKSRLRFTVRPRAGSLLTMDCTD